MSTNVQARKRRIDEEPKFIIGMDAHSRKLAISIWDWSDRFNPVLHREYKCVGIDDLAATYRRHMDLDSITIIEASTNSTMLKNRLNELGFRAEVVRADLIADKERKRKVCDIQDARNLAKAYIKGDVDEFVWTPSDTYAEYKDILFAYRDAHKELVRCSNRIWSICSRKGYPLPIRSSVTKTDDIRAMIEELSITGFIRERLEILVEEYEWHRKTSERLRGVIAEIVLQNPKMLKLMQLTGVNFRAAFAIQTATEDATRFPTSSKFKAYCGFAPIADSSGEEEEKAKKKGGLQKPLDGEGRRDLKSFLTEAGQTVMNKCPRSSLGRWGWRRVNAGKHKNKIVCAIGGKLSTYAWHIMRGDPTPNRESEELFKRKMVQFYSEIGKTRMHELGYSCSRTEFSETVARSFYGHLPPKRDETQDPED